MELKSHPLTFQLSHLFSISLLGLAMGFAFPIETDAITPQDFPVSSFPQTSMLTANASVQGLGQHLQRIGAKFYGVYWCPHCRHQKAILGQALLYVNYIECDARAPNAQPRLCRQANIRAYPTWEIKGKFYPGVQSLEQLANLSGYQGDRNFPE